MHRLDLSAFVTNLQFVTAHHRLLSAVDLDADLRCVENIASLRALPTGVVACLTVLGYYVLGDGGGGTFYWDASATEPDNAGTIFVPGSNPPMGRWKRLGAEHASDIQVRWFGAKGDATADDTDAIRKAIDFSNKTGRNASVVFGAGIFRYSDTILIPASNLGISLIGSRDAAAQQGSARPATVLRWTGGAVPTFTIASTFTTFKDMAVENVGNATYFAEVEPSGAGRVKFYGVSCQSGGSGPTSKPFSRGFLKSPVTDYNRIERCEFAAAAPAIVDMDGSQLTTSGTTTFYFVDNVVDAYFDTDVFRLTNCPFELLKIVNNTFNAQSGRYADSGLTVVNSTNIDKDHVGQTGYDLGNLIFRENEYDDDSGVAGARMLKLRRTRNLDLENNNIQGNGQNEAMVELTDSAAHVGKNVAVSTAAVIKTLDKGSRVFFKHNNMIWGRVNGLLNSGSSAGIVAMSPNLGTTNVPIFGQLGDPGAMTTYQFDTPDNQNYTIYVAQPGDSNQLFGYMTRGQKVLVVVRNTLKGPMGTITFGDTIMTSGPFTVPRQGTNRAILFECCDAIDVINPNDPNNKITKAYMTERWRGAADVPN